MDVNVRLEVRCPNCNQVAMADNSKLPQGRVAVLCRWCCHQFHLEPRKGVNIKVRTETPKKPTFGAKKPEIMDVKTMAWLVEAEACNGFRYDLKGLGTLVRAGLITKWTQVRAPGSTLAMPAGNIMQLQPFFAMKERAPAAWTPTPEANTDITLNDDESMEASESGKIWYEMDCSDFFGDKVVPFLTGNKKEKAIS